MIIISIAEQKLYHHRKSGVCYVYPVSTASKGAGNQNGSLQTPLGKHRIANKIGAEMPRLTAFKGRQAFCIYDSETDDPHQDWILSRILWLQGCEAGINRRGQVDSHARYIYIHGTHEEQKIGTPASHGCIRMRNNDVVELFEHVELGESVRISI
ncbi:MAG: L,D-transpeptidase [Mariprofundus sp.]|nr:L,D-transpeptidase [Mariprofundus sp.]